MPIAGGMIMKKNKENVLLRALIIVFITLTVLVAILLGAVAAIKPGNPIKTVISYVQNGFSLDEETSSSADTSADKITEHLSVGESGNTSGAQQTQNDTFSDTPTEDIQQNTAENDKIPVENTPDADTEKAPVEDTVTSKNEETSPVTEDIPDTTKDSTTDTPDETTASVTTSDTPIIPNDRVDDPDYFKDALFIGDSRTVGFSDHGTIDGATYFARTSMNVKNCFDDSHSETDTGDYNLEEFLQKYDYGKIYILLGINEIGYPTPWIISGYEELINRIRELQPNAIIIIQSNMHVTEAKDSIPDTPEKPNPFKNEKIDEVNAYLAAFADNEHVYFLDTTSPFDDATGNLDPSYSRDGIHFNASGYRVWRDYVLEYGKR